MEKRLPKSGKEKPSGAAYLLKLSRIPEGFIFERETGLEPEYHLPYTVYLLILQKIWGTFGANFPTKKEPPPPFNENDDSFIKGGNTNEVCHGFISLPCLSKTSSVVFSLAVPE